MARQKQNTIFKIAFFSSLILVFGFTIFTTKSASDNRSVASESIWPGKRELRWKLWQIRQMVLVYGTKKPKLISQYRKMAEQIAGQNSWLKINVKSDSEVSAEELSNKPLYLIGTPESNRLFKPVLKELPVHFFAEKFSVDGLFTSENRDVITVTSFPSPFNHELPMSFISGVNDRAVLQFLAHAKTQNSRIGDFRVFRSGSGIVLGFFKQSNGKPWTIDKQQSRNFLTRKHRTLKTEHYVFDILGQSISHDSLEVIAQKQEQRLKRFLSAANIDIQKLPPMHYYLYASAEDKGLITGNTNLSHYNSARWEVHSIYSPVLNGVDLTSDIKLITERVVGKTASFALRDGLALAFSDDWGRFGYRHWVKIFQNGRQLNSLKEILDNSIYRNESYLFMQPQAGSFVSYLFNKVGARKFMEFYRNWPAKGLPEDMRLSMNDMEKEWWTFISDFKLAKAAENQSHRTSGFEFQKGFCFAHEGYQIYNGYLSEKARESLKKVRSLGTNWISLTPFGYLNDRHKPSYLRYSFGAGSENDESIVTASATAKELGMEVMLKPHILMNSSHWGWPGDIEMTSDADWRLFFKFYVSWIRHYALLAEMYNMDSFCVGIELMHTTTKEHEKEWREVIRNVRSIYHGSLVYAANWWQEFEQITFWDDLDYIGLNCYFPLSKKDRVTLDDLKQGIKKVIPVIAGVADTYKKRVIITEIGFTSSVKNWQNPHERKRGAPVDLEDQVISYKAAFETLWSQKWLAGIFWWKWPTYLENGGPRHNGFTPNAKPAEQVVKQWYSKNRKAFLN